MKKLFILLLCLFSLCFVCLSSVSFCADAGIFVETTYNGNGKAIIDAIIDDYFNGGDTNNEEYLEVETAIYHAIQQPYKSIYIKFHEGTGTYWQHSLQVAISSSANWTINSNMKQITLNSPRYTYTLTNYRNTLGGSSTTSSSNLIISLTNQGSSTDLVAFFTDNYTNKWYQNSLSSIHIGDYIEVPDITFTWSSLATDTTYSGDSVKLFKTSRSVTTWNFGTLSSNFKELPELHFKFGPLFYIDNSSVPYNFDSSYAQTAYYTPNRYYNGKLMLNSDGTLSIYNSNVLYNQLYLLYGYYSLDGSTTIDLVYKYVYFKPIGSDNTIGEVINPDLNNNVDIGFIQSFGNFWEEQTNFNSGEVGTYIDDRFYARFSGDFYSGDLFSDLGYRQYTTSWDSFIYDKYHK